MKNLLKKAFVAGILATTFSAASAAEEANPFAEAAQYVANTNRIFDQKTFLYTYLSPLLVAYKKEREKNDLEAYPSQFLQGLSAPTKYAAKWAAMKLAEDPKKISPKMVRFWFNTLKVINPSIAKKDLKAWQRGLELLQDPDYTKNRMTFLAKFCDQIGAKNEEDLEGGSCWSLGSARTIHTAFVATSAYNKWPDFLGAVEPVLKKIEKEEEKTR